MIHKRARDFYGRMTFDGIVRGIVGLAHNEYDTNRGIM